MSDFDHLDHDDDSPSDETRPANPIDLLPVGDTDVLADTSDEDDAGTGGDVAEEVDAMHVEGPADDVAADAEAGGTDGSDADAEEDEPASVLDDPTLRPGQWYVVHTQSGYEKKVTANLEARIQSMNMEDKIFEIGIPMEELDE
mgnify:FL=1